MSERPLLLVTAAAIVRDGKLLLARRRPGKAQGGLWELPGGKIEPGEAPEHCLARELREELGLDCRIGAAVAKHRHRYPSVDVELFAYWAEIEAGELRLVDHDAVAWVAPSEALSYALAPADIPLVQEIVRVLG